MTPQLSSQHTVIFSNGSDARQNIGYSPYGEIEETRLGISAGAKQLQFYNRYEYGTRRLADTHTVDQTHTGYTSDVDYAYGTTGNVKSVTDNAGGKDTQCFAYDGYRRLSEAWTPSSNDCATARSSSALGGPAPYWTSWAYKPGGLRDDQTEHVCPNSGRLAAGPTGWADLGAECDEFAMITRWPPGTC
jgi:hypothetical protein